MSGWYCTTCGNRAAETPARSTVTDSLRMGRCSTCKEETIFRLRDGPTEPDFEGPVVSNPDPNSQAAARMAEPYASGARRKVWSLIAEHPTGLACWEVEQITGGLHQSVSATINWLHNHGALERRGTNRTPSGRTAYIYHAVVVKQ